MSAPEDKVSDSELLEMAAGIFEHWEMSSMMTGFSKTIESWLGEYRRRRPTEAEAAMAISDFFARKALEGVGSTFDVLYAIRDTLKPWIKPLKDEDVAIVGGEVVPRPPAPSSTTVEPSPWSRVYEDEDEDS